MYRLSGLLLTIEPLKPNESTISQSILKKCVFKYYTSTITSSSFPKKCCSMISFLSRIKTMIVITVSPYLFCYFKWYDGKIWFVSIIIIFIQMNGISTRNFHDYLLKYNIFVIWHRRCSLKLIASQLEAIKLFKANPYCIRVDLRRGSSCV